MRFFVEIAYNGTNYHGWQIQPNGDTVQERINDILSKLHGETINCVGCGRTDAGVHASKFYLHFDAQTPAHDNFVYKLNRMLPKDICVRKIIPVTDTQHARFDAFYRAYDYYIHFEKSPFLENLSHYYKYAYDLDFEKMQEAFSFLAEVKDFTSLCKKSDTKTNICQIYETNLIIDKTAKTIQIHIAANRFLRGMIRLIVGSLLAVGEGKVDIPTYKEHILAKKILPYNNSVLACGLYLSDVRYPFLK